MNSLEGFKEFSMKSRPSPLLGERINYIPLIPRSFQSDYGTVGSSMGVVWK